MKLTDLFDLAAGAGDWMAELLVGSVLAAAGAGCAFHNQPRPLDSAEIEKATAATSTTLATSSGVIVRTTLVSLEFFRFRPELRERFSLRGIEDSFCFVVV
jgi:hypothetical protein